MSSNERKPTTPGFNSHMEFAFTADKNGRPVAYYWNRSCIRWMRTATDAAKLAVAQELATEVRYVKH